MLNSVFALRLALLVFASSMSPCLCLLNAGLLSKDSRSKRQTEDECLSMCTNQMHDDVSVYLPEYEQAEESFQNDPFSTTSTFTQSQLRVFCEKLYIPFSECLSHCDTSEEKMMLITLHKPTQFICVDYYEDFYRSIPCIMKVQNETKAKCLNKRCADRKNALKTLWDANANEEDTGDFVKIKELQSENCRLEKCLSPCILSIYRRKCGKRVSRMQKAFLKVYHATNREIYEKTDFYPEECNSIFR